MEGVRAALYILFLQGIVYALIPYLEASSAALGKRGVVLK